MASISSDKNGHKRLLVILPNGGGRKPIRLGKMSMKSARTVKDHVEELIGARNANRTPADETTRWIGKATNEMLSKLAAIGLVEERVSVSLEAFIDGYVEGRHDIKPRTRINFGQTKRYLLKFFPADRPIRSVTSTDAEAFHQFMAKEGLGPNTIRRTIGRCRQLFKVAIKRGLVQSSNPFDGLAAEVKANPERFYFIKVGDAQKVLDACPDSQWRLIFALCRYGGLRCPSEVLSLRWTDVNWEKNLVRVPSPKTEHHAGGASRMIPLFPELLPYLRESFDAEPGTEFVISKYRDTNTNLRSQLQRIILKAGLEAWPKLFQNLRSTRETELAEKFPMHVVCRWMGNSELVAAKHYLQLTDGHFERAINPTGTPGVPGTPGAAGATAAVTTGATAEPTAPVMTSTSTPIPTAETSADQTASSGENEKVRQSAPHENEAAHKAAQKVAEGVGSVSHEVFPENEETPDLQGFFVPFQPDAEICGEGVNARDRS